MLLVRNIWSRFVNNVLLSSLPNINLLQRYHQNCQDPVECDLKRFHIAFDTKKIPFFLPNPATFCHVELSRIWVEFGRIRLLQIFVESGRIHANSIWDPTFSNSSSNIFPNMLLLQRYHQNCQDAFGHCSLIG